MKRGIHWLVRWPGTTAPFNLHSPRPPRKTLFAAQGAVSRGTPSTTRNPFVKQISRSPVHNPIDSSAQSFNFLTLRHRRAVFHASPTASRPLGALEKKFVSHPPAIERRTYIVSAPTTIALDGERGGRVLIYRLSVSIDRGKGRSNRDDRGPRFLLD